MTYVHFIIFEYHKATSTSSHSNAQNVKEKTVQPKPKKLDKVYFSKRINTHLLQQSRYSEKQTQLDNQSNR